MVVISPTSADGKKTKAQLMQEMAAQRVREDLTTTSTATPTSLEEKS